MPEVLIHGHISISLLANTFFMKKPISIFALLFLCSLGCKKSDPLQNQPVGVVPDATPMEVAVLDRGRCACSVVVSSGNFEGLTICRLSGEGDDCHAYGKHTPQGQNHTFCIDNGQPFRIINNGTASIQVYFVYPNGASAPIWILPNDSAYYSNDFVDDIVAYVGDDTE